MENSNLHWPYGDVSEKHVLVIQVEKCDYFSDETISSSGHSKFQCFVGN